MLCSIFKQQRLDSVWLEGLAELLGAGLPLLNALQWLCRGRDSADWRSQIYERVEGGDSLSEALSACVPGLRPELVAVLRVGEYSGRLAESLQHAAGMERTRQAQRSRLVRSLTYPCMLLLVAAIVLYLLLVLLLPQMLQLQVAQSGGQQTGMALGLLYFLNDHGHLLLLGGFAVVGGLVVVGVLRASMFEQLPLFGAQLRASRQGKQLQLLGTLLGAGLTMDQAVVALRPRTRSNGTHTGLDKVAARLREGWTFTEALSAEQGMEEWVQLLAQIGEQTGTLPEQLQKAGQLLEQRWLSTVDTCLSILEPTLILGMAACVGAVGWLLLTPLLQIGL